MTRGEIWWVDFGLAYGSIKMTYFVFYKVRSNEYSTNRRHRQRNQPACVSALRINR